MSESRFEFGRWLRPRVEAMGDVVEFCNRVPMSKNALYRWMREPVPSIRGSMRSKLANALGLSRAAIDYLLRCAAEGVPEKKALAALPLFEATGLAVREAYKEGWEDSATAIAEVFRSDDAAALDAHERVLQNRNTLMGRLEIPPDFDANAVIATLKVLQPIPQWDLSIAAGGWSPVPVTGHLDYDDPKQRAVVEQGLFRVKISGDSMSPRWLPGDVVEFELFRPDRDVLTLGEDYLCIRSDEVGTFKTLVELDEDQLVFRAVNRRKYPAPLRVPRQEVARLARALHVIMDRRRKARGDA